MAWQRGFVATACLAVCIIAARDSAAQAPGVDLYGDPLPQGAVARMGTVRFRADIADVAFPPDGAAEPEDPAPAAATATRALVAVLSWNGTIRFIDPATGATLRELSPPGARRRTCSRLRFTPDGRTIAVVGAMSLEGQEATIRITLWDAAKGAIRREIVWSKDIQVHDFDLAHDGRTAVTIAASGMMRFWDIASGEEVLHYNVTHLDLQTVTFSRDDKTVAAVGRSRGAFLWRWLDEAAPRKVEGLPERPLSAAFSADGKHLAVGCDGTTAVAVVEVKTGRLLRSIRSSGQYDYVRRVAFTPDGKLAFAGNDPEEMVLADPASGQHIRRFPMGANHADCLAVSPDGRWLAAGDRSVLWTWRLDEDKPSPRQPGHLAAATFLSFLPDGQTLVSAGDDWTARTWDVCTGRQLSLVEHGHWIRATAVSPGGDRLATSSLDDTVRLGEIETVKEIYRLPGHGRLGGWRALGFTADGMQLVSWGDDMYLRAWDVDTGKAVFEHAIRPQGAGIPDDIEDETAAGTPDWRFGLSESAITPDGRTLILTFGEKFHVFDVRTGAELRALNQPDAHVASLAFSPDSRRMLSATLAMPEKIKLPNGQFRYAEVRESVVRLADLTTGAEIFQFRFPHPGRGRVAFSPDGSRIAAATGSPDMAISIWNAETFTELAVLPSSRGRGIVSSLAFSADGKLLASGMQDTSILVWDLAALGVR